MRNPFNNVTLWFVLFPLFGGILSDFYLAGKLNQQRIVFFWALGVVFIIWFFYILIKVKPFKDMFKLIQKIFIRIFCFFVFVFLFYLMTTGRLVGGLIVHTIFQLLFFGLFIIFTFPEGLRISLLKQRGKMGDWVAKKTKFPNYADL